MIRMLLALLAACLLAATAAAQEHVIRIWGPDAMREVAQRWADSYRAVHPELRFELTMKGSDTAMPGLYTGKADIALLARETTITDDNGFLRNKSYPPTRLELMRGSLATPGKAPALVLLVHAANPLRAITLDQITALFGCKGRAKSSQRPHLRRQITPCFLECRINT